MRRSFIDPLHNAKVTPTGRQQGLYNVMPSEFERLKSIRNLGLVGCEVPTAYHKKFDHTIGVIHLLAKAAALGKMPSVSDHKEGGRGFGEAFEVAAAAYHIGHLPFTYSTERALLLAAARSAKVRSSILEWIGGLDAVPARNGVCTAHCASDAVEPSRLLRCVIDDFAWRFLYRFFSAAKLFAKPALTAQFDTCQAEALHILVCPDCECGAQLRRLDTLDYTLRDLKYVGTTQLQCNIEELIADENASEWDVIQYCDQWYLENNLYSSTRMRVRQAVFEKALTPIFIRSPKMWIEMLEPAGSLSTDDLFRKRFSQRNGFEGLFDSEMHCFEKTWAIWLPMARRSDVSADRSSADRALLVPGGDRHPDLVSVASFVSPAPTDFSAFARQARRLVQKFPAFGDRKSNMQRALLEFLLGCDVEPFATDLFSIVGEAILRSGVADVVWNAVEKLYLSTLKTQEDTPAFRSRPDPTGSVYVRGSAGRWLYGAATIGMGLARGNHKRKRAAAAMLAEELLVKAGSLCSPPARALRDALMSACTILHGDVVGSTEPACDRGRALEAFAALHVILERGDDATYRWLVTDVVCLHSDGNAPENEYDLVEIALTPRQRGNGQRVGVHSRR